MNKKIIAFGLSLIFVWSLNAIQPGAGRTAGQPSKKALPQMSVSDLPGITVLGSDGEATLLREPVYRTFGGSSRGTADTLNNGTAGTVSFGFEPGQVMMEIFQAPTDLIMWGAGIDVNAWNTDAFTPSLKVEVWAAGTSDGYPFRSDGSLYPDSLVDGDGWAGYAHPSDNDTTAYPDPSYAPTGTDYVWNDFVNGGVCDTTAEPALGQSLYGTKVLPKGFVDYTITNPDDGSTGLYWVDFTQEGGAVFEEGDWITIVVTYLQEGAGTTGDAQMALLTGDGTAFAPLRGAKFYNDQCDGTGGETGFYIRHYNWRYNYAVELTGDRGPVFEDVDELVTTLSIADRTFTTNVTDDNPSGAAAGVASVTLNYQLDSLTATVNTVSLTMTDGDAEDGTWTGTIPGQVVGTFVYWDLTATDNNGLSTDSAPYSYTIFAPTAGNALIFNNQDALYGSILYSSYLYFYTDYATFDIWDASYGGITDELVVNYSVIIEEAGTGPYYDNDDEIAAWWDGDKTYIVSSDEWLGARSNWTDGATAAGSVARDILGIAHEYNDINYAASGDQAGVSRLVPLSTGFASVAAAWLGDSLFLNYDPDYETGGSNWLDGVDAVDGYTVDMTGYSLVLDSADQLTAPTDSEEYDVMIHGQAGNGGKSAFLAFDAMALNTVPSYYWIGASAYAAAGGDANPADASPLIQAYNGLAAIVSVEDDVVRPKAFSLKGNYPNPFNPTTNIAFNLNVHSDVTVTVYSLLGEEVATIHNSSMQPGLQSVKWNGTDSQGLQVASGVYIYRVEAQNSALTGKMMLLK